MNLDQILIQRSGYTVLDLLSDVGGLQGILISAMSLLLSILHQNQLNDYLVSKLFKQDDSLEEPKQTVCDSILHVCIGRLLPSCCCRKRRK